jgi:hypothetical protein
VLCLLPERPRRSDEAPPGVFTFLLEEQNRSRATRAEVSPDESQSRVLRMLPGAIRAPVRVPPPQTKRSDTSSTASVATRGFHTRRSSS